MKLFTILLIVVTILSVSSCKELVIVKGSENMVEKEYDFTDFENIVTNNLVHATLIPSEEYKITLSINKNATEYLDINKDGKTLNLTLVNGILYDSVICNATVYMPRLNHVQTSGISNVFLQEFKTQSIHADLYEMSSLTGTLFADSLEVIASKQVKVNLEGKVGFLKTELSGESIFNGKNLKTETLNAYNKSTTKMFITVTDTLRVEIEEGSQLEYYGNPSVIDEFVIDFADLRKGRKPNTN